MPLAIDRSWTGSQPGSVELSTDLGEVLGGALDGLPRDRFIRLVGPDQGGFAPTPPVVHGSAGTAGPDSDSSATVPSGFTA